MVNIGVTQVDGTMWEVDTEGGPPVCTPPESVKERRRSAGSRSNSVENEVGVPSMSPSTSPIRDVPRGIGDAKVGCAVTKLGFAVHKADQPVAGMEVSLLSSDLDGGVAAFCHAGISPCDGFCAMCRMRNFDDNDYRNRSSRNDLLSVMLNMWSLHANHPDVHRPIFKDIGKVLYTSHLGAHNCIACFMQVLGSEPIPHCINTLAAALGWAGPEKVKGYVMRSKFDVCFVDVETSVGTEHHVVAIPRTTFAGSFEVYVPITRAKLKCTIKPINYLNSVVIQAGGVGDVYNRVDGVSLIYPECMSCPYLSDWQLMCPTCKLVVSSVTHDGTCPLLKRSTVRDAEFRAQVNTRYHEIDVLLALGYMGTESSVRTIQLNKYVTVKAVAEYCESNLDWDGAPRVLATKFRAMYPDLRSEYLGVTFPDVPAKEYPLMRTSARVASSGVHTMGDDALVTEFRSGNTPNSLIIGDDTYPMNACIGDDTDYQMD